MKNDPPKMTHEQLHRRLLREDCRNRRDAIDDQDLAFGMSQAANLPIEFERDFCFRYVIREILGRHDGKVPPSLKTKYIAARADFEWLNSSITITGGIPERTIQAISKLAISIHEQHARLAELAGRPR